jgi:predicted component of type VI protein secretion system
MATKAELEASLADVTEQRDSLRADNEQLQETIRNQITDFEVRLASITQERDTLQYELEQARMILAAVALSSAK